MFFFCDLCSSGARVPSSVGSSMIHPYPGSAARARERSQALQAYFQQPSNLPGLRTPINASGSRRSNNQGQMGSSSDQNQIHRGGLYFLPTSSGSSGGRSFPEAESSMVNPFQQQQQQQHAWERDVGHPGAGWGFHQSGGGVFRQWHSSERSPSQGHHYRS